MPCPIPYIGGSDKSKHSRREKIQFLIGNSIVCAEMMDGITTNKRCNSNPIGVLIAFCPTFNSSKNTSNWQCPSMYWVDKGQLLQTMTNLTHFLTRKTNFLIRKFVAIVLVIDVKGKSERRRK